MVHKFKPGDQIVVAGITNEGEPKKSIYEQLLGKHGTVRRLMSDGATLVDLQGLDVRKIGWYSNFGLFYFIRHEVELLDDFALIVE